MRNDVAVLCVEPTGAYPSIVADWYDEARDARTWQGGKPVVAHPPCGPWGKLAHQCTRQDATLGPWAVDQVRRWGGVLEHPAYSNLWPACGLPLPGGLPDQYGGFTVATTLAAFGADVHKPTWLYVAGREPWPTLPRAGRVTRTVESLHSKARQLTPPAMASFLCELAAGCTEGVRW